MNRNRFYACALVAMGIAVLGTSPLNAQLPGAPANSGPDLRQIKPILVGVDASGNEKQVSLERGPLAVEGAETGKAMVVGTLTAGLFGSVAYNFSVPGKSSDAVAPTTMKVICFNGYSQKQHGPFGTLTLVKLIEDGDKRTLRIKGDKIDSKHTKNTSDHVKLESRTPSLLRSAFLSGRAHILAPGGKCPVFGEYFGWHPNPRSPENRLEPQGSCIGYICSDKHLLYMDPSATFSVLRQMAEGEGESIPLNRVTFWKRIAEKGWLAKGEGRNIGRKAPTEIPIGRGMALKLSVVLDQATMSEVPTDVTEAQSEDSATNIERLQPIRQIRHPSAPTTSSREDAAGQDWGDSKCAHNVPTPNHSED